MENKEFDKSVEDIHNEIRMIKDKEFNLSGKRIDSYHGFKYREEDVKEFIRLIKEDLWNLTESEEVWDIINKRAGDKLGGEDENN